MVRVARTVDLQRSGSRARPAAAVVRPSLTKSEKFHLFLCLDEADGGGVAAFVPFSPVARGRENPPVASFKLDRHKHPRTQHSQPACLFAANRKKKKKNEERREETPDKLCRCSRYETWTRPSREELLRAFENRNKPFSHDTLRAVYVWYVRTHSKASRGENCAPTTIHYCCACCLWRARWDKGELRQRMYVPYIE